MVQVVWLILESNIESKKITTKEEGNKKRMQVDRQSTLERMHMYSCLLMDSVTMINPLNMFHSLLHRNGADQYFGWHALHV